MPAHWQLDQNERLCILNAGTEHRRRRRREVDYRQLLGKVGIDTGDTVLADKKM
ncbi:MAG: hypothetical protein ACOX2W_02500 [Desulfomonilia bacterium]|nr:hypothetical protein [Desulfomonilia bacterium]